MAKHHKGSITETAAKFQVAAATEPQCGVRGERGITCLLCIREQKGDDTPNLDAGDLTSASPRTESSGASQSRIISTLKRNRFLFTIVIRYLAEEHFQHPVSHTFRRIIKGLETRLLREQNGSREKQNKKEDKMAMKTNQRGRKVVIRIGSPGTATSFCVSSN